MRAPTAEATRSDVGNPGCMSMEPETASSRVVVLLSGGIDSAACLAHSQGLGMKPEGVFVNYGQAAAELERRSARQIANHYDIPLQEISCTGPVGFGPGLVLARNAFLVMAVAMWMPMNTGKLVIGIHAGTRYYDCTPAFLDAVNVLLDGYTDGRIRCVAPFLDWDRASIFEYCRVEGVPIELTYSCEAGADPACGRCLSCRDRMALDAGEAE